MMLYPKERDRLGTLYGTFQLTIRFLALILSIATLVILLHTIKLLPIESTTYGTALASTITALVVNAIESTSLIDCSRTLCRASAWLVFLMDLVAMGLGAGGAFCLAWHGLPCCEDPSTPQLEWEKKMWWHQVTIGLVSAVAGLHALFALWDMVDICRIKELRVRKRRDARI